MEVEEVDLLNGSMFRLSDQEWKKTPFSAEVPNLPSNSPNPSSHVHLHTKEWENLDKFLKWDEAVEGCSFCVCELPTQPELHQWYSFQSYHLLPPIPPSFPTLPSSIIRPSFMLPIL